MIQNKANPPVFFVRHKFQSEYCRELQKRSMVAYNYLDEFHEELNDYSESSRGLTQAYNAFSSIIRAGAIVVAEYESASTFVVGKIAPGSALEKIDLEGHIFKALKYSDAKTFSYSTHPLLAAIRPPFVTACGTGRSFTQMIRHLYLGEKIEIGVDFMHPSSIELMCEAFLRSDLAPQEVRLQYTLLRTGKTMPAVDIFGKTIANKKIFAQVTFSSEIPAKTKSLVEFAAGTGITVLFSRDRKTTHPGLDFHFCIDDVFDRFMNSGNQVWVRMLQEMVGVNI